MSQSLIKKERFPGPCIGMAIHEPGSENLKRKTQKWLIFVFFVTAANRKKNQCFVAPGFLYHRLFFGDIKLKNTLYKMNNRNILLNPDHCIYVS